MGWKVLSSVFETTDRTFTNQEIQEGIMEETLSKLPEGFVQKEVVKKLSNKTTTVFYEKEIKQGYCSLI